MITVEMTFIRQSHVRTGKQHDKFKARHKKVKSSVIYDGNNRAVAAFI